MKKKYMIETAIALENSKSILVQQVDFEQPEVREQLESIPCHIYMICSRPRITLARDKIKISKDKYSLEFIKHYSDRIEKYNCEFDNKLNFTDFELNSACNYVTMKNEFGESVSEGKTALLYANCISEYDKVLDFKVLYIGQAFGTNGSRMASDRLISHNTLQKIYSDASCNNPTDEIWLVLWQFQPYFFSVMGGHDAYNSILGLDESIENYNLVTSSDIPMDQQITITEAAMIKYFEPYYNTEYKTTFPSSSHASYEFCYKLDLNSVNFKIDTIELCTRLYSDKISSNHIHVKSFSLYNEALRENVFNKLLNPI